MLQKEKFTIKGSEDKAIIGDYTFQPNQHHHAVIIFTHGFKGFKDWGTHNLVAEHFAEKGFIYLKFNLSHSGVPPENPNDVSDMETFAYNTISKELYDLHAVIDYTEAKFTDKPIYLIGHSRGGGLAIITAAKDKRIKKLITWSSIADFSSLWKKEQEEEWLRTGKIFVENARTKEKMPLNSTLLEDFEAHKDTFDILKASGKLHTPWLILHGDDDVNVDFTVAHQLAQRQLKAKIQKISGANHVYGASHPYTSSTLPEQLQDVVNKTLSFITK